MTSPHRTALIALISLGMLAGHHGWAADNAGWKPLFDGKTLNGWYVFLKDQNEKNKDPNHLVQVHDGMVHMYKDAEAGSTQPFGYIATEKEYSNYHVRVQYKWGEKKFAPRANAKRDAGLLYHHGGADKVWPTSVECQIQEGDTGDIWCVPSVTTRVTVQIDPKTTDPVITTNRQGIVRTNYSPVFQPGGTSFVANSRVVRNPENEIPGWNTVEVIVRGDTAIHIVNGKTNNICSRMEAQSGDNWVSLTKGRILLQLEGSEVSYRNMEIKELKESVAP